ncbi:hypothetical protein GWI33_012332 [Rhynchophorus ferrugineus]|uniref:N-acetyltransferase domain-containing protein n=1 Tax=Rhynchophorus ferrugineus TaxID=354439 RepID=A0A834IPV2_RHYFE|nr:hypothetical protein GWI33_012332 [Rhynchophorus ferrugineus]
MSKPRVWATSEDGTIEYVSLTKDTLPKALETMQKSFYVHENVCLAFDTPNQPESFPEIDGLLIRAAVDGVSIVAIDKITGEIAGAAFNKLEEPEQSEFYPEYLKNLRYSASKGVTIWMYDIENMFDIFDYCKVNSLLEIMFVGILPSFRKRGIAKKLFEISIDIARELKVGNNVKVSLDESTLALGNPPQIIATKIYFDKFVYDGCPLSSKIDKATPYLTYEYLTL